MEVDTEERREEYASKGDLLPQPDEEGESLNSTPKFEGEESHYKGDDGAS